MSSAIISDSPLRNGFKTSTAGNYTSGYGTVASVTEIEIPNKKDRNQWLAGGELRQQTMPGGFLWSPTDVGNISNTMSISKNANILNGNLLPFLGYGLGEINNIIQGGSELDLMFDDSIKTTSTYTVVLQVTNLSTGEMLVDSSSDFTIGEDDTFTSSLDQMDLMDLKEAWDGQINGISIISSLQSMGPIGIAMSLISLKDMKMTSIESTITKVGIGTITSTFSSMAASLVGGLLGFTGILGMVVNAIMGYSFKELAEIGLKLDNKFGYSGELVGVDVFGDGIYEAKEFSVGNLLNDLKKTLGFDYNYGDISLTDFEGDEIGAYRNDYSIDDMTVTGIVDTDPYDGVDYSTGFTVETEWGTYKTDLEGNYTVEDYDATKDIGVTTSEMASATGTYGANGEVSAFGVNSQTVETSTLDSMHMGFERADITETDHMNTSIGDTKGTNLDAEQQSNVDSMNESIDTETNTSSFKSTYDSMFGVGSYDKAVKAAYGRYTSSVQGITELSTVEMAKQGYNMTRTREGLSDLNKETKLGSLGTFKELEKSLGLDGSGSGNDDGDSAFGASTSDAHASGMQGPGREDGTF